MFSFDFCVRYLWQEMELSRCEAIWAHVMAHVIHVTRIIRT